jgi:hypothetical protein
VPCFLGYEPGETAIPPASKGKAAASSRTASVSRASPSCFLECLARTVHAVLLPVVWPKAKILRQRHDAYQMKCVASYTLERQHGQVVSLSVLASLAGVWQLPGSSKGSSSKPERRFRSKCICYLKARVFLRISSPSQRRRGPKTMMTLRISKEFTTINDVRPASARRF